MTPAPEKAAPIPAVEDAAKALLDDLWNRGGYGGGKYEHAIQRRRFEAAYPKAADLERALADRASQEERIREDERAKCLADVDYIRENIRFHQTPNGRKRFDIYDLDRALRNTCTLIRERITGEDKGKWTNVDPTDAEAARLRGGAS